MGIDPDAYMAGAIPSLNRGGSWRIDDGRGSRLQSFQGPGSGSGMVTGAGAGHGGSIFPRPSIIVPPAASQTPNHPLAGGMNLNLNLGSNPNMGNRGNFLPFQSQAMSTTGYPGFITPSMGSPSNQPDGIGSQYQGRSGGSQKAGSVRPTLVLGAGGRGSQGGGSAGSGQVQSVRSANHPGWASLSARGARGGVKGHKSSPNSPTTPSSANFIAAQATSQYGLNQSSKSQIKQPLVSPRVMEPVSGWDWDTASHKRTPTLRRSMTAGPDYFSLSHDHSPQTTMTAPNTPLGGRGHHLDSLPPPPRPAAPQSPRPRHESQSPSQAHKSQPSSPYRSSGPTRRHTHDRFSPPESVLGRGGKGGQQESKSLGLGLGRGGAKSGSRKATFEVDLDVDAGSEAGESYYAPSTKTYAHTLDDRPSARHTPAMSTSSITATASSRPERTGRPGNTRRSTSSVLPSSPLASGVTRSSFGANRFKNRPHLGPLSTITSTVDFTQTAPSSATGTGAKHHRQPPPPSMDMRSLQDALTVAQNPVMPQTAPAHGYIPPTSEDDYDPYAAHPAPAPAPTTLTQSPERIKKPQPTGAGLKHVTPDSYRPPGFPKPVKQLAWNREGPAMKTYGVAWLREAEPDKLPGGPAGPRYIQARPPNLAIQSGGSWWDSAA